MSQFHVTVSCHSLITKLKAGGIRTHHKAVWLTSRSSSLYVDCCGLTLQIEYDAYAGWDQSSPAAAAEHGPKVCHLLGLHHPTIIALLLFCAFKQPNSKI